MAAAQQAWRDYHEATKHTVEKLRRSTHTLDWANMPDPFRHYDGAPVVDLPAAAPPPHAGTFAVLSGQPGVRNTKDPVELLSQILFHAAAISATKVVPSTGYRYALRVNPSSGNLHPTEFHFATRTGLYHYRPSSHTAELRATGDYTGGRSEVIFYLTSIGWREAWKYRERAYRYCLLDIGHAWQALVLSALASGYGSETTAQFDDAGILDLLRVADEWPMLVVSLRGAPAAPASAEPPQWYGGQPNQLSAMQVDYPIIERIHQAASVCNQCPWHLEWPLVHCHHDQPFSQIARQRRSALDFAGGSRSISREQFQTLLDAAATHGDSFVRLYAFVHRVEDLDPGIFLHGERLRTGDQRVAAAGLSLGQDLAGNACVTFSMVAGLNRATAQFGERGYRLAHFEAGAIGHRLYLAAEAMGFQATGIGAFYDDAVHRYLGIDPAAGQVIYHFACGYAVRDPRVSPSGE
jgi:SagB-type dehydrogenase family enzyme